MVKKIAAFLAAGALVFSLGGCMDGGEDDVAVDQTTPLGTFYLYKIYTGQTDAQSTCELMTKESLEETLGGECKERLEATLQPGKTMPYDEETVTMIDTTVEENGDTAVVTNKDDDNFEFHMVNVDGKWFIDFAKTVEENGLG